MYYIFWKIVLFTIGFIGIRYYSLITIHSAHCNLIYYIQYIAFIEYQPYAAYCSGHFFFILLNLYSHLQVIGITSIFLGEETEAQNTSDLPRFSRLAVVESGMECRAADSSPQ